MDPTSPTPPPIRQDEIARPRPGRFSLACQIALILYACAAGYGGYAVWSSRSHDRTQFGIVLGLPAMAAILFLLATAAIPNLLAPRRMVFPLNLTLPAVYSALMLLSVMIFTSTGNSLIVPYERIRIASFWAMPSVLVVLALSQCTCLTVLALLKNDSVD